MTVNQSTAFVVSAVAPAYAAPAEGAAPVAEVVRVWFVSAFSAEYALELARADAQKEPALKFDGWHVQPVAYASLVRGTDQVHKWMGDVPKPVSRRKG